LTIEGRGGACENVFVLCVWGEWLSGAGDGSPEIREAKWKTDDRICRALTDRKVVSEERGWKCMEHTGARGRGREGEFERD